MVEAVELIKLHPTAMTYLHKVFEHLEMLWMGIWRHTHTITTTEVSPDLGELTDIFWWCQHWNHVNIMVETVEIESLSTCIPQPCPCHKYIKVFERRYMLWMSTWGHTQTISTTCVSSDLWKLADIRYPRWCQECGNNATMLSLQTTFLIHVIIY